MIEEELLPKGWTIAKLDDLIIRMTNGANVTQFDEAVGFPISRIETIWNQTIDFKRVKYIKESDPEFIGKYKLQENDILFSHINSDIHIGKTAIIKNLNDVTLIHGINLLLLRVTTNVSAEYLNYQLNYLRFSGAFAAAAQKSVNQSSINQVKLKSFDISLPPLAEQHRIVTKIEELFSDLNKGIETLKTAKEQLKIYRQAVLKYAFEGRLTNPDLPEGELPDGWNESTIKDVCLNIKVGIVIKPTNYYSNNGLGVKAFRSANVREFRVNDTNWVRFSVEANELNFRTQVFTGDVLIVRSGYPGTSCVVTEKFSGCNAIDILIATPQKELLLPEYLCAFNNSPLGKGMFAENSRGVAQKHLNVGEYSKLKIFIPELTEQRAILDEIESRLSICDKIEESIEQGLQQAEALRQSILKRAFVGNLVPQDPNDEPAQVLLERIKSVRANAQPVKKQKKFKV